MAKKDPTVDEHYVPQFYLKLFSDDQEHIYQFDKQSGKQTPVPVPIKSVCYTRNLYEFGNAENEFVQRNLLENILAKYEGVFQKELEEIIKRAENKALLNSRSFLTTGQKGMLIAMIVFQILRMPEFIDLGTDLAMKIHNGEIQEYQARNFTLLNCLPFYMEINAQDNKLLSTMFGIFEGITFITFVSDTAEIFTSDKPIYLHSNENNLSATDTIIFPLSANTVVYILPRDKVNVDNRNRLFKLPHDRLKEAQWSIAASANRWVYSKRPFTEEAIKLIMDARKEV